MEFLSRYAYSVDAEMCVINNKAIIFIFWQKFFFRYIYNYNLHLFVGPS